MEDYSKIIEFAPLIVVVLMFLWQHNLFVRPEQMEKKHREIIDEVDKRFSAKYVEINAYKEFQNHIYSELGKINVSLNELKSYIMKRRKDDNE